MAISPKSKFMKEHTLMKTAGKDKAYGVANMTSSKQLHVQINLSNAETEASTLSFVDTKQIIHQLEREIFSFISNEQKWLRRNYPSP